ncbi:MAG: hypothetical protein GXO39_06685, partial [Thermotogae bacterium]|nr:hypothetical protein [Thermotogota bacterium]
MAQKDEVRSKVGGLLTALLILLIIVAGGISLALFIAYRKIPSLIENKVTQLFGKPFKIGDISPGLRETRIRHLELENIASLDSLVIGYSLPELISRKTIRYMDLFGGFFDSDSFIYYYPSREGDTTGGQFTGFPQFKIDRITAKWLNYRNVALEVFVDSISGYLYSDKPAMEFFYKGYTIEENKSLKKKADSFLVLFHVRKDTLTFEEMHLWGDSVGVDSMYMTIYPPQQFLTYGARSFVWDNITAYWARASMRLDSMDMKFRADSLYSADFPIYDPLVELRFRDTIYVDTAILEVMDGKIYSKGFIKDSLYTFYGYLDGLRVDSNTTIFAEALVNGSVSGRLDIEVQKGKVQYDKYLITGIVGRILTGDGKIYQVPAIYIRDPYVIGRVEGFYNMEDQSGEFLVHMDTIYPSGFVDTSMKGHLDFVGKVNVGEHFFLAGGGSVAQIQYFGAQIPYGVYTMKMMDSLLDLQAVLDSINYGTLYMDKASLDVKGIGKHYSYSFVGRSPYGSFYSLGNVDLLGQDTIHAFFDLLFANGDTILNIKAGTLKVESKSIELFASGTGLRVQVMLDSPYVNVYATASAVDFRKLLEPFGISDIGGEGNASMVVSGTFDEPEVSFLLDIDNLVYQDYRADYVYLSGGYGFDTLRVESLLVFFGGGKVHGAGYVNSAFRLNPMALSIEEGQVNFRLKLDSIDLGVIEPLMAPNILLEQVKANGKIEVEGDLTNPVMKGGIVARGQAVTFAPMDLVLDSPGVWIRFYRNIVRIDSFRAVSEGGGRVGGRGLLNVGEKFRRLGTDILIFFDNMYLSPDDYSEYYLSGDLTVRGDVPSVFIEGDVNINSGYLSYPVGYNPPKRPETPNPIRYLIRVKGDRRIYFSNELVDAELSARIKAQKTADIGQYVEGRFQILRGKVYLLDREFRIIEGTINMVNDEITLNIRAEADMVEDTIIAILTGTLKEPKFDLVSKKGLSKYEILAMLTLGGSLGTRSINLAQTLLSR